MSIEVVLAVVLLSCPDLVGDRKISVESVTWHSGAKILEIEAEFREMDDTKSKTVRYSVDYNTAEMRCGRESFSFGTEERLMVGQFVSVVLYGQYILEFVLGEDVLISSFLWTKESPAQIRFNVDKEGRSQAFMIDISNSTVSDGDRRKKFKPFGTRLVLQAISETYAYAIDSVAWWLKKRLENKDQDRRSHSRPRGRLRGQTFMW